MEEINEKHAGGRPPLFKSVKDIEEKIQEFRDYVSKNKKPMTVERLCVFLDCDRKTLINYQGKDEFFHAIKKIKNEIGAELMENLIDGNGSAAGQIFNLKNNYGYQDKTEHLVETREFKVNFGDE